MQNQLLVFSLKMKTYVRLLLLEFSPKTGWPRHTQCKERSIESNTYYKDEEASLAAFLFHVLFLLLFSRFHRLRY